MTERTHRHSPFAVGLALLAFVSVLGLMPSASAASPHWMAVKGTPAGRLNSVSCASAKNCIAVGSNSTGAPLVMRYNGHKWTSHAVTFPAGSSVFAVSCPTHKFCMAVGYGTAGPLAEKWNGTKWTQVTAAIPGASSGFKAVSCPTAKDCWAVGGIGGNTTLAEHWTGKAFKVVPSVTIGTFDYLNGVSCAGKVCVAVGGGLKGGLFERSSGKKFVEVKAGHTAKGYLADLWSVSCPTSKYCVAAGEQDATKGAVKSLTEIYRKGRFTTVASPNPTHLKLPYNTFLGVTCVSTKDCWAAGEGGAFAFGGPNPTSKDRSTIAARWNGKSWKVAPSANPGNKPTDLVADSCVTPKHCFAVGTRQGNTQGTLIEKLTG